MRRPTFVSLFVWINGAVPAALLLNDAWNHQLGANPVNFALLTTGLLALIFLTLSLAVTPLRDLTRWDAPFPARRTLGLWAAIYAFAHFGIFFWWDRERSVSATFHEIVTRKYLWYGTAALLIFIPLVLTSTQGMIRRLGRRGWKGLHRTVYLAAIGAALHYMLQGKVVTRQSIVFASVIGGLLLYRLIAAELRVRRDARLAKRKPVQAFAVQKPKFWRGQLKVIKTFDETPEVRTFRLAPLEGTSLPFDYKPGQYMNLSFRLDGQTVNRSYTIASSPTRAGHCELTVKREEMGTSSRHLHRTVQVGDRIDISAPAGKFTFDEMKAGSIVMIAGGVGITPLMSKVRYLTDLAWPGDIFLIVSARAERDIIFRDELTYLAKRYTNLRLTITLTRADDQWRGERGRVSAELLNRVVPELTERMIHICGPDEMADGVKAMLVDAGVPEPQIAMESFTPPVRSGTPASPSAGSGSTVRASDRSVVKRSSAAVLANGQSHTLMFTNSGLATEVAAEQVILDAAEAAGVAIDFDCRSGICGTCKVKLISGDVSIDADDALSDSDRRTGIILACQARCLSDVEIDA